MSDQLLCPELALLAERTRGNPYRRFRRVSPRDHADLLLADLCSVSRSAVWTEGDGSCWVALSHLPWDSHHLGVDVGRIDVVCAEWVAPHRLDELTRMVKARVDQLGVQYLQARVVVDDGTALTVLSAIGFRRRDTLLNLSISSECLPVHDDMPEVVVRAGTQDDEEFVREVAFHCFENRLLGEEALCSSRVRALYAEWASNDLHGRVPLTLIGLVEERRSGFVSGGVRTQRLPDGTRVGFVDLVVVDGSMRQRGIGRALLLAAMQRMREEGAAVIELNVAGANAAARRLYERLGFREQLRFMDLSMWCGA
jgi:ribosomal protein S18 acetylase RimI-like enzyme